MALEHEAPRHTDFPPPFDELGAVLIVEMPDCKTAQEDAQSEGDHLPHDSKRRQITLILASLDSCYSSMRPGVGCFAFFGAEFRSDVDFHDIDSAEQYNSREEGVCVLVEAGVLQIVIVDGNTDCD